MNQTLLLILLTLWLTPFVISMSAFFSSKYLLKKSGRTSYWNHWYNIAWMNIIPLFNLMCMYVVIDVFFDYHLED